MRVHLLGVRGSTPSPGAEFVRYGGHTSCVALAHDGQPPTLVLDGGTGIRGLGGLLNGRAFEGTILLGHLHWDHTQGLPFCAPSRRHDSRVRVLLPAQNGEVPVEVLARAFGPPHFPIRPEGLFGNWSFEQLEEGDHGFEGFEVTVREIPHTGQTFGFRVNDGRRVLTYISDHMPTALGAGGDGLGTFHDAALELARDADILLHDAQDLASEWPEKAMFGHSTVEYAVGLAARAGVKRLVLFHHDPDRTDAEIDAIVATQQGAAMTVEAAVQGAVIDL